MPPLPPCVAAFLCVDFWRRGQEEQPAGARKGKRSLVGKASFVWRRGPSHPHATAPSETLVRGGSAPAAPDDTAAALEAPSAAPASVAVAVADPPSPPESRPAAAGPGSTASKAEAELPYASPADAAPSAPPDDDYTEPGSGGDGPDGPDGPDAPYQRPLDHIHRTEAAEEPDYALPVQHRASEQAAASQQPLPPPRRRQRAT